MNFTDYNYERVDMDQVQTDFEAQLAAMQTADDMAQMDAAIKAIYVLRNDFETMSTIASVRFSLNMRDEFYYQLNRSE